MTPPRLYLLLGSPVGHSLSPALHAAAFAALGEHAVYAPLETRGGEVEAVMRAAARRGGGNVTLPHKERAAAAVERGSEAVEATGACNCFWGETDGTLAGDNTDVEGFLEAVSGLRPGAGGEDRPGLRGCRVLLLGAGGAARAVLHALDRGGAARVDVLNRTTRRAERIVERVAGEGLDAGALGGPDETEGRYDLVVNATSLGLEPDDPLPLDLEGMEAGAAFDLVYGTEGTRWTRHARRLGIPARDGVGMLIGQAAASLRRWLDRELPVGVAEAMREAARSELGGVAAGSSEPAAAEDP